MAHLTCVGAKKIEIENILEELKKENIENVLALRGDFPKENESVEGDFRYASKLI